MNSFMAVLACELKKRHGAEGAVLQVGCDYHVVLNVEVYFAPCWWDHTPT